MDTDDEQTIARRIQEAVTNLGGPTLDAAGLAYIRPHVDLKDESVADPRGRQFAPLPVRVLRVVNADGSTRMRSGHSPVVQVEVEELVQELCSGFDRRHNKAGRHVGAPIRFRPFGTPL